MKYILMIATLLVVTLGCEKVQPKVAPQPGPQPNRCSQKPQNQPISRLPEFKQYELRNRRQC
jgi:hypothetical protein